MNIFESETKFARQNLPCEKYKDKLNSLEKKLHNLSHDLKDAQTEYLQDNGYVLMTIDDIDILVSEDWSFQELYSKLQQMPAPQDSKEGYALNYNVSTEDIKSFRNSEKHNKIIKMRENIIDDITDVYKEFWVEEVKPIVDSNEEAIIYMMAGLDKDINADVLSSVLDIDKSVCTNYTFDKDNIVIKK